MCLPPTTGLLVTTLASTSNSDQSILSINYDGPTYNKVVLGLSVGLGALLIIHFLATLLVHKQGLQRRGRHVSLWQAAVYLLTLVSVSALAVEPIP